VVTTDRAVCYCGVKSVVDGFGAWMSEGCSNYDVVDLSSIAFNCTQLAGYAVLLVQCCMLYVILFYSILKRQD